MEKQKGKHSCGSPWYSVSRAEISPYGHGGPAKDGFLEWAEQAVEKWPEKYWEMQAFIR